MFTVDIEVATTLDSAARHALTPIVVKYFLKEPCVFCGAGLVTFPELNFFLH